MPKHSETTVTPTTNGRTPKYMGLVTRESGARTVAEYVASRQVPDAIWIVTTTTPQGIDEAWRVRVTKVATL